MGDLCQNCGDCHLGTNPTPCKRDLTECIICHNLGHQFIFCPKSVKLADKKFQYLMMCHNCDAWHLPNPCPYDLTHCNRCGNYGHLPHFCPANPLVRGQDPSKSLLAVNTTQVHPELLRKIKIDACAETLRLLENHGKDEVFNFISRPILPPLQSVVARPPPVSVQLQHTDGHAHIRTAPRNVSSAAVVPYESPFARKDSQHFLAKPLEPKTSPSVPPTPQSAMDQVIAPKAGSEQNPQPTKQTKQPAKQTAKQTKQTNKRKKSEQDEAAKAEFEQDNAGSDSEGQAPKKKKAKSTKPKPSRQPTNLRCADCKKRHKKCEHMISQASALEDGSGPSQSPQTAQTPNTMNLGSDDSETQMGTPTLMKDTNNTSIVRIPIPQNVLSSAGTQTDFGKQTGNSEPITQEQQEELRSATAAMPAFQQLETQDSHLFHGNLQQSDWLAKSAQKAMSGPSTQVPAPANINQFVPNGSQFAAFHANNPILESNGHRFFLAEPRLELQHPMPMGSQANTFNPTQMMAQMPGFVPAADAQRVVAPNRHNSNNSVLEFGDDGKIVGAVQEQVARDGPKEGEGAAQTEDADEVGNGESETGG